MKELDFDELDRAVNSLMGGVSKTKPVKPDEDGAKTLTINPSLQEGAVPNFDNLTAAGSASQASSEKVVKEPSAPNAAQPVAVTPVETAKSTPVPSESPAKAPSLAARRGGRFMDVVHPSSDMKAATPAQPVSRQGVTIEPTVSPKQSVMNDVTAEKQEVKSTPMVSETASISTSSTSTPANDWPDPLEMADFKQQDDSDQQQASDSSAPEQSTPLTSPFLSGTKVEKRPLGGVPSEDVPMSVEKQDDTSSSLDAQDASTATTGDPAAQLPAEPADVEAPLPEELRSDLMAIESGTHSQDVAEPTPTQDEKQPEAASAALSTDDLKTTTPVSLPVDEAKETTAPSPAATATDQAAATQVGPTSITQQYKEEPSTGDQTSGAIYDTDTYHQPLAHPAKKKSGWMWVIWIVLILLLGAGGGVAVYLMGIV